MTVTVPELDDHSAGILAALNTTDVTAARGDQPPDTGWVAAQGQSEFVPYMVLHTINAGFDGPVSDSEADVEGVWQVTSVGANQTQCEQVGDVARHALRATTITIAGRTVTRVRCEPAGSRPDRTVTPVVWINTDRYRITTTPTT